MQPYKPYDDFCSLEPFQQKKEEKKKREKLWEKQFLVENVCHITVNSNFHTLVQTLVYTCQVQFFTLNQ